MRLNEMYPNLQREKKWSNFAKDIDQKQIKIFAKDISLNIEVVAERVTESESA